MIALSYGIERNQKLRRVLVCGTKMIRLFGKL